MPDRSEVVMGTIVTIHAAMPGIDEALDRAFQWFFAIEECCSRFNPASELSQLTRQIGSAVRVSDILYQSVAFALTVAEETGGAFDPTVGHSMERRGYNREHRTQTMVETQIPSTTDVSYRDIELSPKEKTITLHRPLLLDLGAVAKGLAVDTAATELKGVTEDFSIDAGGDLYMAGCNAQGVPWRVGIRHPREDRKVIEVVEVSDEAVCTSGDYERGRHILDARTGAEVNGVASATVIAPSAMLADAMATAVFVLGPAEGIGLLRRHGLRGMIYTPELERFGA